MMIEIMIMRMMTKRTMTMTMTMIMMTISSQPTGLLQLYDTVQGTAVPATQA